MQYVPLTVHLNALAQLYQQCAALSEKHDRLAKGMDIFNTDINQPNINPMIDQERLLQDQNLDAIQIQDLASQKPNSPQSSEKTPVEIDLITDENMPIEQGTKPIQSETKKIKKPKLNLDSTKSLQCQECKKFVKNTAGLKRHQSRMHSDKPLKNLTKKMGSTKQKGIQVLN
ncbi:unnamed protein product [Paramecium sonneborni]|uniref:C2H2-type domain-containing protein n=1 Tax=Paramecium sonneborni TaxID=65129 RepID=A0A8S1M2H2_9CILI|nr:unnamed protein product [Paramecium sonneborni]